METGHQRDMDPGAILSAGHAKVSCRQALRSYEEPSHIGNVMKAFLLSLLTVLGGRQSVMVRSVCYA
jgi:hypothetical protein